MKLKKKIEIAKVGVWNKTPVTEDMLLEMKDNFQLVPVRAGHIPIEIGQKTDGFIESVEYQNNTLSAWVELSDQLAKDYENKKYLSWSIDADKYHNGWNLTGLALLGTEKPGIKGLRELQFSEDNQKLNITFQEEKPMELTPEQIKSIAEAVVLSMSEKKEPQVSEKEIELQEKLDEANKKLLEFSEKEKTEQEKIIKEHNAKVEAKKTEILQFSESEANEFEIAFKDKPELSKFMSRWKMEDPRPKSKETGVLSFSENGKDKSEKTESVTEAQLRLKNEKMKKRGK